MFWKRKKKEPAQPAQAAKPPQPQAPAPARPPAPTQPQATPQATAPAQPSQPAKPAPVPPPKPSTPAPQAAATPAKPGERPKKQGLFAKLRDRLRKTSESITQRTLELFRLRGRIDDELLEQLEEVLISSDIGFDTTQDLIKELRNRIRREKKTNSKDFNWLAGTLRDLIHEMLEQDNRELQFAPTGPTIYLVIGVNGVGKTTAIGKMAYRFKNQGKKVLLVAADTFRAAAIEQLVLWSEEADVPIVAGKERSDPSSVVYTAMTKAKETQPDIVIIDTAGRLHTKHNLMQELAKMSRVISRDFEGAPHETLLVLDASTGQNALSQARVFMESCGITGLILTKLDGTAKGGIVLALHKQLQLPVKFIGVGEEIEDLEVFNPDLFSRAIFPLDPIEGEMPPESTPVSTASS
ncbi:MAG: signal recognition particle-docking protein FtsY [bacterium]|jgi:fused signal recognition particle receptor|nr:signal recognition particle-docking protein FtsY [bacterium]